MTINTVDYNMTINTVDNNDIELIGYVMSPTITGSSINVSTKKTFTIPTLSKKYIKRVYYNQDKKTGQWHTTVSWIDDSKTTVACQEGDTPDKEKGLAMCICKKLFGNKGNYNEIFKEFCKDD